MDKPERNRSRALVERLRSPKLRPLRIIAGIGLIVVGALGFLPLAGFWMLPLGLAVLAVDFPAAKRLLQKLKAVANRVRRFFGSTAD